MGRDQRVITELSAGRRVLDVHADVDHNRTVVTLAATSSASLAEDLMAQVGLALERIDLTSHAGVHPRVGAADVLPIVPLGGASMNAAVTAARELGERIWAQLRLPVYFYGEAAGGRRLAEIRRTRLTPDLGGPDLHPTGGAVCVGARWPLVAYNINFDAMAAEAARRLVRRMRQLPGVQALAFPLSGGRVQLSMNLTRLDEAGPAAVHDAATRLAGEPGTPELVGLCPARVAGPGCQGGLLEARLAGAAARSAGLRSQRFGDDEHRRLAGRLEAEARSLPALETTDEAMLAGAERALAILRILRPAALEDDETAAFLRFAASGLRAAVHEKPELGARLVLFDRWLREA